MFELLSRLRASRRDLFSTLGIAAGWSALPAAAQPKPASIYESIGVRPLINARGTVTIVGATRMLPEVKRAMDEASKQYVQIDELMDAVGKRLGGLTGAEWGIVTAGASAALTVATGACIAGGDPDKHVQLPNLAGLKDEVIMPSYSRTAYDAAARSVGARIIEVADAEQLASALGPRTAMIMVLAGGPSNEGPLSVREIAKLAKPKHVPILVDAAAEGIVLPNPHIAQGADLVAYSGGKCLRGPQCAGLLIGRKDLVRAAWSHNAPHHGFGRGLKVGREEIVGMLVAVEQWHKRDHAREEKLWTSWLEHIEGRVRSVAGVTTEIQHPRGLSNRTPSLKISWDPQRIPLTGYETEMLLYNGEPRVAVSGAGSFLPFPPNLAPNVTVVPYQLEAGEERIIANRIVAILSKPPKKESLPEPLSNISGQWDVEMTFSASVAKQRFVLEQSGSNIAGTHFGSFATRDLSGGLHGRDILIRSSYTREGVRLNFEFSGTVNGDAMQGSASLGEYGIASWKATRRRYRLGEKA